MKIKRRKIGFTRWCLIKRIIREFFNSFMIKYSKSYRYGFDDGYIKDGVDELLIPTKTTEMKKINGKYERNKDDDGYECIWVIKY